MDEKDKKEKYIKFLYELKELPEAFTGLQVQFLLSLLYLQLASHRGKGTALLFLEFAL